MGYKLKVRERISLSELGTDLAGNPFYVEIKNPKMMLYDEKMSFIKFAQLGKGDADEQILKDMKTVIGSFITSWNLISMEDESPLQIPKQDPEALNKVPSEVIETILRSFGDKVQKEDEETKNSLEQSVKS